jgi:hypothetical protein
MFRAGAGLKSAGSGFTLRARAFAGLAWPGGRARGLACGLSPKTRPAQAWAWARSGPANVMILEIFLPKQFAFFAQNIGSLYKYWITRFFKRKRHFFRKLAKMAS